ncbi:hypothetical protein EYR41_006149 [Orbilia oligospora]|uniref:Uncharacterized protein n=1 Tax=Orbilia oligospora TaxID=2813651 RepID=A0A7C8K4B4_ORBOL|nr:hypothetical protein TWF751_011729 [Orbilia oligospora]TGJ70167.1 hypothetical protein EYR41_006149 [Orbilia oligospora]
MSTKQPPHVPPKKLPSLEHNIAEMSTDNTKTASSSKIQSKPKPKPKPQTRLANFDVPDLSVLEQAIERECFPSSLSIVFDEVDGVSGNEYLLGMHCTSTDLEIRCRDLEAEPNALDEHYYSVHALMDDFKKGIFRPCFLSELENLRTKALLAAYRAYLQMCEGTRRKIKWFKGQKRVKIRYSSIATLKNLPWISPEKKATFKINKVQRFITKKNVKSYSRDLEKLESRLKDYHQDLQKRTWFLTCQKYATVRLLIACRRYKAIQKDRLSSKKLCSCREEHWERDLWTTLGLPVIDVPARPQGFIPI